MDRIEIVGAEYSSVLSVLKAIDHAETPNQALAEFQSFTRSFGINRYLVSQMVNPLRPEAQHAMRYTNFPDELIAARFTTEQLLHDPVVQYGLRSRFPFSWKQAYDYAGRYGRKLMLGARDYGLNDGLMFPMRRPGRPDGGVSLSANQLDELDETATGDLQLACLHVYSKLEGFSPSLPFEEIRPLAPQEIDVLQFAAIGKTFWEMSVIMGVSEAAAKDAMRRARAKLGAVNTSHAISTAIARDLILP